MSQASAVRASSPQPWLYVIKDGRGKTRPFVVNATDFKAAEDIAYEHLMRLGPSADVINIANFQEWVGPDCVELLDIKV